MGNWNFNIVKPIFISLSVCLCVNIYSQNTYWTQQYSSYANLMGGAGMSNSNENSVFYYNPGAIGFIDTMSINVSANVYAYDRVKLINGAGNDLDLVSNKLVAHAQVLAGNIYFKKAPRLRFVYGYLMRNMSRLDFEQNVEGFGDYIPQAAGLEYFKGAYDYSYQNGEYWGGIGLGYKINEHISVGLGHWGGYINTKNSSYQDLTIDAVGPDSVPYVASVRQRLKYKLDHFYLLFKPGIDLRFGAHKIGIASMLPSLRGYGNGRMYQSLETGNLHIYTTDSLNLFTIYPNFVVVGDQRNVRTVIKQAPSISLGYEYEAKRWKLAFITEYFFPVREYDLLHSKEPVYARPEEAYEKQPINDFMRIRSGSYGVLNVGMGFDMAIAGKLRFMTGFRTDFNNKIPLFKKNYKEYITSVDPHFWNYLHFSFGLTIEHKNRKTFVGLIYKYGFSNYNKNFVNMTNPTIDNLLLGSNNNNMRVNIHGVGFTIGYSIFSRVDKMFKPFSDADRIRKAQRKRK